ncbi:MAG TPA: hypothetical protein VF103_17150 [Polyangiaceae bacterium]
MRRYLLVGLLTLACGGEAEPRDRPSKGNPPTALRPVVTGDFVSIAGNPDLGALTGATQQPVDFAIWMAADGTWQLWSCIRFINAGGGTRLFYRWEGRSLTQPDWTPMGIALESDTMLGEPEHCLQAPHVVRIGDTWHLVYGTCDAIGHATSTDGKSFERVIQPSGTTAMFSEGPGLGTRDPMLFVSGSEYRVYYTAGEGYDFVRTSSDLATWSPSTVVAKGGSAGMNCCSAECPFVIQPDARGDYFLFRTQRYGADSQTSVYRSPNAFDFGIDDDRYLIGTIPLAAPEIIHVGDEWFIAALKPDLQGIQIARLTWEADS